MGKDPEGFLGGRGARGRLRRMILVFLAALLVPLVMLFLWTYRQLEDESFLSLRLESEAFVSRVEERIAQLLEPEEKRPFDEYGFFSVTETSLLPTKAVRFSPLAELPLKSAIAGIIGYFQINPDQSFQTPLLPDLAAGEARLSALGIGADELDRRQALQNKIGKIVSAAPLRRERAPNRAAAAQAEALDARSARTDQAQIVEKTLSELKLDEAYVQRNVKEEERARSLAEVASRAKESYRATRKEQVYVPEQSALLLSEQEQAPGSPAAAAPAGAPRASSDLSVLAKNIVTFEGEIDPLQLRLVDGEKLLLYRRVWREKARYLQGFVVEAKEFFRDLLDLPFSQSILSGGTTLRLAYEGHIMKELGIAAGSSEEKLVFKTFLDPPFNGFEVVISTAGITPGNGAVLVFTLSGMIVLIVIVGLHLIYRLALSQIELSEQKTDFVSAVSHELRTPLTSIRMYAEMLKAGWVKDQKKERIYYDFIFSESERLSRLISNVLQLARLSRNDTPLALKRLSPQAVLGLIEEKVRGQVTQAGFTLTLSAQEREDHSIEAEEDALVQIFINLVDNALKFARDAERKEIVCGYRFDDTVGELVFFVRDFGPGVPAAQQKKIFQLFYRAESELTRATPGTGIGLALVKELARRTRARVDMVNCNPGAEFRVRFRRV